MPLSSRTAAFSRITAIASKRTVHAAFSWLHTNDRMLLEWQKDLCAIPAPPFGEQARSEWMARRFQDAGLAGVATDDIGNVLGYLPAPRLSPESTGPIVVVSAHLDTVFPMDTPLRPVVRTIDGRDRLEAPGASDNAAGVVGMLALAHALVHAKAELPAALLFVGNVGEEGEGDLRGVRHLYSRRAALAGRIVAHIVLDGAGADSAVTQALGSRRYQVTIAGPGGHSFTDAGTPNPITALASALAELAATPLPEEPRTILNLGTIHGGTSVNSIPESATATIDLRSTSTDELVRLEVALHRAVEDSVAQWNARATPAGKMRGLLKFSIESIGNRPAAQLAADSPILDAIRAVDRHLGLQSGLRLGSTDANIPISLGIPSVSVGAGGEGGGAHTLAEWYDPKDRELGLRRVLLLMLAMTEWAAEQ
ncbi:MAG TPA: M20/M25/M40 family metallo-hydrolase [Terracidiphilus sp.]|jgi:acetylornithine deacetylase/succinyl-diaminopimelate desuccinylase-like protein|nr:M20/M25/M40 family metallo-hydrolase [Terracidiphilus sp.]